MEQDLFLPFSKPMQARAWCAAFLNSQTESTNESSEMNGEIDVKRKWLSKIVGFSRGIHQREILILNLSNSSSYIVINDNF